jgi:hypothetical protein
MRISTFQGWWQDEHGDHDGHTWDLDATLRDQGKGICLRDVSRNQYTKWVWLHYRIDSRTIKRGMTRLLDS